MVTAYYELVYAIVAAYVIFNLKHDIQMLQQNSYFLSRYWKWLKTDIASGWRLIDLALIFLLFSTLLSTGMNCAIIACVCLWKIWNITHRTYKKPLVYTPRVKRIYWVASILVTATVVLEIIFLGVKPDAAGYYSGVQIEVGTLLLWGLLSWIPVCLAVIILTPVEKAINKRYYDDAARILKSMPDLKVIGITGSYGKTSTKHFLHRILSEEYDVLMTPGSYNTTMGVIRTVREMMKPYNQIFICEMGAKRPNDVKEICDLVHPQIGILTAVGPMHLESFKTIENVQKTKFELIDSLSADGLAILNNDFEYVANRKVENVETFRYGVSAPDGCAYWADDIRYSAEGTEFTVRSSEGLDLPLKTRLVGEGNISNLVGSVVAAIYLKVSEEKIRRAVMDIEQVEHRLSIKRTPGGVTILDDAFNSNPTGSRMAIDVLSQFRDGRRIVITPGMIELGDRQTELNEKFGEYMGSGDKVDEIIVVGQYNRDAIIKGVESTDFDRAHLHTAASFNDAQQYLSSIIKPGDTVLYENDLPDTFK